MAEALLIAQIAAGIAGAVAIVVVAVKALDRRFVLPRRIQVSTLAGRLVGSRLSGTKPPCYTVGIRFKFRMKCCRSVPDSWEDIYPELAFVRPGENIRDSAIVWRCPDNGPDLSGIPRQIGAHDNLVWQGQCSYENCAFRLPQKLLFRVRCEFSHSKARTAGPVTVLVRRSHGVGGWTFFYKRMGTSS